MRVLGLLIVLVVGPQLVPGDRLSPRPLRLAYADNAAFRSSLDRPVASRATSRPTNLIAIDASIGARPEPMPGPIVIAAVAPDVPQRDRRPTGHENLRVHEADDLPAPPAHAQRLAALTEPTHLLGSVAPLEELTAKTVQSETRAKQKARPRAKSTAKAKRRVRRYRRRSQASARRKAQRRAAKVPRWAEQMFVSQWQSRAFAYQ